MEAPAVARIRAAVHRDPTIELTIDVERRVVAVPALGYESAFALDDASRARLLAGQDEIDRSLAHADAISAYELRRADWLPRVRTESA